MASQKRSLLYFGGVSINSPLYVSEAASPPVAQVGMGGPKTADQTKGRHGEPKKFTERLNLADPNWIRVNFDRFRPNGEMCSAPCASIFPNAQEANDGAGPKTTDAPNGSRWDLRNVEGRRNLAALGRNPPHFGGFYEIQTPNTRYFRRTLPQPYSKWRKVHRI